MSDNLIFGSTERYLDYLRAIDPLSYKEPIRYGSSLASYASYSRDQFIDGNGSEEIFEYFEAEAEHRRAELMPKITNLPIAGNYPEISYDNPINTVLSIESQLSDVEKIAAAYREVNRIIKIARATIPTSLAPIDSLKELYKIIHIDIRQTADVNELLSDGLSDIDKKIDCDTGCYIFLAVGHELKWPLHMVSLLNHAFIVWMINDREYYGFETTIGLGSNAYQKTVMDRVVPMIDSDWDKNLPASVYVNVGNKYGAIGRDDLAIHMYTRALLFKPYLYLKEMILFNRGVTNHNLGRYYLSIEDQSEAIRLNDKYACFHSARAASYIKLQRLDLANKNIDRAISLNPGSAIDWFNRGFVCMISGNFYDARSPLIEAVKLDPNNYKFNMALGYVNLKLRFFSDAVLAFSRAAQIDPANEQAQLWLGLAQQILNLSLSNSEYKLWKTMPPLKVI